MLALAMLLGRAISGHDLDDRKARAGRRRLSWCSACSLPACEQGSDLPLGGEKAFVGDLGQTCKVTMGGLDRREIRRGLANRATTSESPFARPRATEVVHRARARYIEEPALFGDGLATACMGDRDKSFLEPGHEDDSPFETLCAVEGQEVDGVADLPRRIGAQARLQPGDEPAGTRA